jgi:hypothetical protein
MLYEMRLAVPMGMVPKTLSAFVLSELKIARSKRLRAAEARCRSKDRSDMLRHAHHLLRLPRFDFETRHFHSGNAAGCDLLKWRKVTADVERKAMERDPTTHTDADRSNLPFANPDPSQTLTLCSRYSKLSEREDEQML